MACADPERVHLRPCPRLKALGELYGRTAPEMWMDRQLTALFLLSASKDSTSAIRQSAITASSFAATVGGYKLTELMLFFARYRAGLYSRSYSAFDLRQMCMAFHHEFAPAWAKETAAIDERAAIANEQAERAHRDHHAISREAFLAQPRDALFTLRLRFHPLLPKAWAEYLRRFFRMNDEPRPDTEAVVRLTRDEMQRIDPWVRARLFAVTDSYL